MLQAAPQLVSLASGAALHVQELLNKSEIIWRIRDSATLHRSCSAGDLITRKFKRLRLIEVTKNIAGLLKVGMSIREVSKELKSRIYRRAVLQPVEMVTK